MHKTPKTLHTASERESCLSTRTSAAASGSSCASGALEADASPSPACPDSDSRLRTVRILSVSLAPLSDAAWTELRTLAREAAQFCNACLADSYVRALGYAPPDGESVFRRAKGRLSGDVRVALGREAFTTWSRHGGKIKSGAQRLALFDADRVLVVRAEHMSKGRRQIHARIYATPDGLTLTTRLLGKAFGDAHRFIIALDPRRDEYVRPILTGLAAGEIRLLKVSFAFERPGRKVFALLAYEKWMDVPQAGAGTATLGPLEADGTLWLRWEDLGRARSRNYTPWVARLAHMKTHFGGIQARLKRRMRRSGPGWRAEYRRALVKADSFSAWVHGELHRLSADVVAVCRAQGLGTLQVAPLEHQDLPMAELIEKLGYKCKDAGIVVARIDPATASGSRAIARPVAKVQRRTRRAATALTELREVLTESY